jgi:serine protease Do
MRLGLLASVCTLALVAAGAAQAQMQPEQPQLIEYSSGTGFFVTQTGHVITNNHVVQQCAQISIHGDGLSSGVKLIARDVEHDLALLKTSFTTPNMAYFNSMKQPLRQGDPVVIIGFPGESWRGHDPVVRTSSIIDMKGPKGEEQWLQFNDSVQQGNSGGPLLDSAGNVVGVVVAKTVMVIKNKNYRGEEIVRKSDVAISLPVVKRFLETNGVQFQTRDSGIYLAADRVTDRARPFIVNVHCRK